MTFFKTLYLVFFLFLSFTTKAQKETENWIFGSMAGISFQNNTFTPILNSSIESLEGVSSISDKDGNLLFYSDGMNVYNRNNQKMPNGSGLLGHWSSTQSSIIIPKPGSSTIYYLFTSDAIVSLENHYLTNGYRYSEIDMSLYNGLGNVTSIKNVLLVAPSTEKLCAVKHANGIDYWVLMHEWGNNKFRAYLVDCNGVNNNFVVSSLGSHFTNNYITAIGQMKFSPNGRNVIMVSTGLATAELFDFNNITGILSNPVRIKSYWTDEYLQPSGIAFDFENLYGAEFSPNNQLLYLSTIDYPYLYQYNLLNSQDISSTGLRYYVPNINGASFGSPGGLQLAPDGKIYQACKGFYKLNVINKPNIFGPACEYVFSPSIINYSQYGLPSFVSSFFDSDILSPTLTNCNAYFTTSATGNISYHWDFGDPFSQIDSSDQQSPSYTYPKAGTYNIGLTITNTAGCSEYIFKSIKIDCDVDIFIPNLITPNEDYANDKFHIVNLYLFPDNQLKIYNRWGDLLYEKNGYGNDWDAEGISDGIYYYELFIPELRKRWNGVLSIIR